MFVFALFIDIKKALGIPIHLPQINTQRQRRFP
jgi:hypothetical protein